MYKNILTGLFFVVCTALRAQDYCNTMRYGTAEIFTAGQITRDTLVYGQNSDWQGQTQNLSLIICYPSAAADTASKRPFVLLIHGGGFVGGDYTDYASAAQNLARRGYVAATVQYRLGWQTGCTANNTSLAQAVYRANQDARAAVRYCLSNPAFRIDSGYIFLQGSSAGAVTALNMQYADEALFETLQPGIVSLLGPLNSSTNTHTGTFRIRGIASGAGGVQDTGQVTTGNIVPLIMFHGTDDNVIPFTAGYPYGCPFFPSFMGANALQQRLRNLGGCYTFCYEPGAGHNYYNGQSSFVQARTAEFFKRTLCADCRQITYEYLTLTEDTVPVTNPVDTSGNNVSAAPADVFPQMRVYPNPVAEELYVDAGLDGDYTLYVYDMKGVMVTETRFNRQKTVPFGALAPGMYSVRIRAGEAVKYYKILKQ